jgi:putative DNA primase/helicase
MDAATSLNWSIIPIDITKKPYFSWKSQQTTRATVEQIERWQKQYNPAAWAVVTGSISNLIILDGDGEAGIKTFESLGLDPHRRTGSGGWHADFEHPGWHVPTLNSKSKKELGARWPGLDIRGDGGYAVFCGRNTEGEYVWLRTPGELDSLDILPNDLRSFLNLLNPPEDKMKRSIADVALDNALSEAHNGRDDACFKLAQQLHDNNYSQQEAETICMEFARRVHTTNQKGNTEPFTETEARAKVASAYSYAKRNPWSDTVAYNPEKDHSSNGNGKAPRKESAKNLCAFSADDAGNGEAMHQLFGRVFAYNEAIGWMYYNGTHWKTDEGLARLTKAAIATLRQRRHAAVEAEMENIVKATVSDTKRINGIITCFRAHVVVSVDMFDALEHLLNCKNGVVNLKTGELIPHSETQYFTYCVPVDYKESDATEWIDYLQGIVGGGTEMIDYLQLALGYSLTGSTREECLFYVYGPTRSGKGTVSEIFLRLLPRPLATMVDFNSFTAKREGDVSNFDLAELKPSRVVFASESQRNQSLNPAKIKQLTGGDLVRASFKHKQFFTYRPQFKVWMLSNWPVNGDPEDDALWGRVRVIPFPNSFLGKEDKSKKEHLKSDEVLSSILYWGVQGAIKWYALDSSGLQTPAYVSDVTKSQRDAQDFVQQWISECCVADNESWTPNEVVIASYTQWCEGNSVTPKKAKSLAQSLQMKGFTTGALKRTGGKVQKGVSGLKIPVTLWSVDEKCNGLMNVTDVTGEKGNSPSRIKEAEFPDPAVTSVTKDQSVTLSSDSDDSELKSKNERDQNVTDRSDGFSDSDNSDTKKEATIPDDFTYEDSLCSSCGCGITHTRYGSPTCIRCNPPKGYHTYSHLVDMAYPKKQHKAEFGKGRQTS